MNRIDEEGTAAEATDDEAEHAPKQPKKLRLNKETVAGLRVRSNVTAGGFTAPTTGGASFLTCNRC